MKSMPATKYKPYPPMNLADRRWPSRVLERAPRWCSVDLRDGNQALVTPMTPKQKHSYFEMLVGLGFEEIEVAYPAASEPEQRFVRELIETRAIPDDVTIQVLTPARAELIDRTFHEIRGVRRAIVHLHNPTSELQRRVVFQMSRSEIVGLAVEAARRMQAMRDKYADSSFVFEYSPESFTGTEPEFALEITLAVLDVWEPTPDSPVIINLPATVELSMPNVYADRIEWFGRELEGRGIRDCAALSVHPHNDRGSAVAAAELALLAGADRVEGTLFGNGERTGNVDLVTLALNLYSQGIDPGLAFWDIDAVVECVERATQIAVHPRHPYAGSLVYTAFSGSHQDAIRKGLAALETARSDSWEVPYLPIDPADLGRTYEGIIRITSQSGKGGVAFVVERELGIRVPPGLAREFARLVQARAEAEGSEMPAHEIVRAFSKTYLWPPSQGPHCGSIREVIRDRGGAFRFEIEVDGRVRALGHAGRGPIEAFVAALAAELGSGIEVFDYVESSRRDANALGAGFGSGAAADAVACIEVGLESGQRAYGVAIGSDIVHASLEAVLRALGRLRVWPAARWG